MNIFYFVFGSVLTISTLIAGLILRFYPPKEITAWYGFRTKLSAKNIDNWNYAHKICANTLLIYSIFSILSFVVLSILSPTLFGDKIFFVAILGLIFSLIGVLITTIIVQFKTLKFDKK